MAGPFDDDDQEKPLDPAVERVRRRLVRFVAINLGLLFLALMAVVVAIVYRANRIESPPAIDVSELPAPAEGSLAQGTIALPAGARILGHAISGARLSLDAELPSGARAIFVYDMGTDRLIGRFDMVEER